MLQLVGGYYSSFVIKAALDLELFAHIDKGKSTIEALAANSNSDSSSLQRLLNALISLDLLSQRIPSDITRSRISGQLCCPTARQILSSRLSGTC